jgi:capsular exopolysaccharide synthesis family protein
VLAPGPGPTFLESEPFRPSDAASRLAVLPDPFGTEQFRRIGAALHHANEQRHVQVVMITSAMGSEGKTLVASNLGLTLAGSYRRRVLLIDADLRRPALHTRFNLPNVGGLSDGLNSPDERPLKPARVSSHLWILPAGEPLSDPMSSLTSEHMRQVIEQARAKFDWVIVDTPPVAVLSDANLLAAMVDAVIMVIWCGKTPHGLVQRAVDAVGHERILGVVLNRATRHALADLRQYHHYYETAVPSAR